MLPARASQRRLRRCRFFGLYLHREYTPSNFFAPCLSNVLARRINSLFSNFLIFFYVPFSAPSALFLRPTSTAHNFFSFLLCVFVFKRLVCVCECTAAVLGYRLAESLSCLERKPCVSLARFSLSLLFSETRSPRCASYFI